MALLGEVISPEQHDASPHLYELTAPEIYRRFLHQLSRTHASHGAMSCLVSNLGLSELAARLKPRLNAKLPDEFECINRFYDGRITPHLHACLDKGQRSAFFSIAAQWLVIDHEHAWQALDCQFAEHDPFIGPLVFSCKQETYLIDHCYPYALIEHFERTDPELLDTVSAKEQYQFFQNAIEMAKQFGISQSSDTTLFCTLSLTRGANFHKEAPWPEKLKAVQAGTASLQEILKSIHD